MFEFLQEPHERRRPAARSTRKYYSGINPYALGFAMFSDIRRICEAPTDEDRAWFPELAGSDWQKALDFAMRNFKDESFIAQYLSPRLIRELRLFAVADHRSESTLKVDSIHDDAGYRRVRKLLAQQHSHEERVPDVQIVRYDKRRRPFAHAAPHAAARPAAERRRDRGGAAPAPPVGLPGAARDVGRRPAAALNRADSCVGAASAQGR